MEVRRFEVCRAFDGAVELLDTDGITVMADTREGASEAELRVIAAWWNGDAASAESGTAALERLLAARERRRRSSRR